MPKATEFRKEKNLSIFKLKSKVNSLLKYVKLKKLKSQTCARSRIFYRKPTADAVV